MKTIAALTFVVLSFVGSQTPQDKPNFAGKWIGGAPAANFFGVVGPQEMVITQDASTITIDRPYGRNRATIVLRLDGTETTLLLDPGTAPGAKKQPPRELLSRAAWEGNTLKISTRFRPGGAGRYSTTIETLSLEGSDLIVERSDEAVGARQGPLRGGMFKATRLRYKKAAK